MSLASLYLILGSVVLVLLAVDLFVAHRGVKVISIRSAAIWSVTWVIAGLAFGLLVMRHYVMADGGSAVTVYLTTYLVEKSLSVDNIFLFLLIFTALGVPREYHHRVLFYGVLGAIVMRMAVIHASAALVEAFSWVLWLAGAFLLYAGIKLWRERNEHAQLEDPRILRLIRRVLPTTEGYHGRRFVVREGGRLVATPLLVVLVLVELTDVVLALDGLPAALTITTDPFIIVAANIFAVLGLRSLYFLLAGVADRLRYLKAAVAVILVFIGGTLVLENVTEAYHLSTVHSLLVIAVVLVVSVVASLRSNELDEVGFAGETP